tara:strand:+ start:80 stop:655 length:576 start_codon:yes stop_codon:yes gene_type:complete
MRRTRIIKQDRLWDIFQKFLDHKHGITISKFEQAIGVKSGYIRSVKSKKRIPKYNTYKAISDTLRDYQRLAPDKYKNYITPNDLEFILDPLYINEAITKRNCSIVELSKVMSKNDHTVGETLRYWKDREFENMTLKTISMFEKALREYDKQLEKKLSWEREQETKPKWDFKAERQRYLETGHFHHLQDSRA